MMNDLDLEIFDFIKAAKIIASHNLLVANSGNLSYRTKHHILMTATGAWLSDMTDNQVAVYDIFYNKLTNSVMPSIECKFHLGILKARPSVNAVLHFQSPYATAVSCWKIMPNFNVLSEIPYHIGKVGVVPYYMPGSDELATSVIDELQGTCNLVVMRNHGQIAVGKDFVDVTMRALFFELACKIMVHSQGNLQHIPEWAVLQLQKVTTVI